MIRKTPYLRMTAFSTGEYYFADADYKRLISIEDSIGTAMKAIGSGVINGWTVYQKSVDVGTRLLTLEKGIGIVPVTIAQSTNVPPTNYIAISTKGDAEIGSINSVGLNRISVISVKVNSDYIDKFDEILSIPFPIPSGTSVVIGSTTYSITTETERWAALDTLTHEQEEVTIEVSPNPSDPSGSGAYRNLSPNSQNLTYPIYIYDINGDSITDLKKRKITLFVNGKPYYGGQLVSASSVKVKYESFSFDQSKVYLNAPLQQEDSVTLRIEPANGIVVAEVETDGSGLVSINNNIKTSAYNSLGDEFIADALRKHMHNGTSASKIQLTTESSLLVPSSITEQKLYVFPKEFGNYTDDVSLFESGKYIEEVYINGFVTSEKYGYYNDSGIYKSGVLDDEINITINFDNPIPSTSVVRLKLLLKDNYIQIKEKLVLNDSNSSKDQVDISIDASDFSSDTLSSDLIPKLSHITINKKRMKPANDPSSSTEEYVHKTETYNIDGNTYKEFFPFYKDKYSARNTNFIYLDSNNDRAYACGSNGLLYKEDYDETITSNDPDTFFVGWDSISIKGKKYIDGKKYPASEYDSPFYISPTDDSVLYISKKFIVGVTFESSVPIVSEKINQLTEKQWTNINSATSANGILNYDKTVYFLADNEKVYLYDLSTQNIFLDITGTPLWSNSNTISSTSDSSLFVGTTDGKVYFNKMANIKIEKTVSNLTVNGSFDSNDFSALESVILATNGFQTEKGTLATVNQSSSFVTLESSVSENFSGVSNSKYHSVLLSEWVEIDNDELNSEEIKKVIHCFGNLFVLTESNIYSSTIFDLSTISGSLSWTLQTGSYDIGNFKDFAYIGDRTDSSGTIVIVGDDGVYLANFNGTTINVFSISQNSTYGTTLNTLLNNFTSVVYDSTNNIIYICGKYGIFQSDNDGDSWRNTIQVLGSPEKNSTLESSSHNFVLPKANLKVVGEYSTGNRVYVTRNTDVFSTGYSYGYTFGYGYGYGEGIDYFDVFNYDLSTYGWGTGDFESTNSYDYGYGYGYETTQTYSSDANPIEYISNGDWVFFEGFPNTPFKILGSGTEYFSLYYLDIEKADGRTPDFTNVFINQTLSIYSKIDPLGIIDGEPQDSVYGTKNTTNYNFDFYRQSITFYSLVDTEKLVEIASKYKAFTSYEETDYSFEEINEDNITITLHGINMGNSWRKDGNVFVFDNEYNLGNLSDVLRLTLKRNVITDMGTNTHDEIENELSIEETGFVYGLDAVRNTNFLSTLMSLQHCFAHNIYDSDTEGKISGIVISVYDPLVGGADPYITTSGYVFGHNSLRGKKIILDTATSTLTFTIKRNNSTTIYLQRPQRHKQYIADSTNTTTYYAIKDDDDDSIDVTNNSVIVTLDGVEQQRSVVWNYTYSTIDTTGIRGITFFTAPTDAVIGISYVESNDMVSFTSIVSAGDLYEVTASSTSPFDLMTNTFVSMYRDYTYPIDTNSCFIENSIYEETGGINVDYGKTSQILYYVYNDSTNNIFYAGTNKGIWKKSLTEFAFDESGPILDTLDASGSITVDAIINGAYIQYDKDTKRWTVTWGGGVESKNDNQTLDEIKVKHIESCPGNSNVLIASTEDAVYRTDDGGSNWISIWDTLSDSRTTNYPIMKSIIFDDIHPWVVNVVASNGLFRSYNYGNTWFKISEYDIDNGVIEYSNAFTYQIDDSSARTAHYYSQREFRYKPEKQLGEFGKYFGFEDSLTEDGWEGEIALTHDILFRDRSRKQTVTTEEINSVINSRKEVDTVFISSPNKGVFRSYVMGNSKEIGNGFRNKYVYTPSKRLNENYSTTTTFDRKQKMSAYNDYVNSVLSDAGYTVSEIGNLDYYYYIIDKVNKKTYVSIEMDGQAGRIPEDGDLVGTYVNIAANSSSEEGYFHNDGEFFEILEHYNRGAEPNGQFFLDYNESNVESRRVDFVLDGIIENPHHLYWEYDSNESNSDLGIKIIRPTKTALDNETKQINDATESVIWGGFFDLGLFGKANGRTTKYKVQDLENCRTYAVRENIFGPDDYDPVYGYGYGYGTGLDYFDVFGYESNTYGYGVLSFESGNPQSWGYGYGFEYSTSYWETTLILDFESSGDVPDTLVADSTSLAGFYIGDSRQGTQYSIIQSSLLPSTSSYYVSGRIQYACRIEQPGTTFTELNDPFNVWHRTDHMELHGDNLGDSEGLLFANKIYADSTTTTGTDIHYTAIYYGETFTDYRKEENEILIGYSGSVSAPSVGEYIGNPTTGVRYEILDVLNVSSDASYDMPAVYKASGGGSNISSLGSKYLLRLNPYAKSYNDQIALYSDTTVTTGSQKIECETAKNIVIKEYTLIESIFAATEDGVYESQNSGDSWVIITTTEFDKIKIYNNTLYGFSTSVGIYSCDITNTTGRVWSQISDSTEDDLSSKKVLDVAIQGTYLHVGTNYGIYRGRTTGVWTWEQIKLPDNKVNSILIINDDQNLQPTGLNDVNKDVDKIVIGTKGRGFFERTKDNRDSLKIEDDWERSKASEYYLGDIESSTWNVKNVFLSGNDIYANTVSMTDNLISTTNQIDFNYRLFHVLDLQTNQSIFSNKEYAPISAVTNFDWSINSDNTITYSKENPFIITDPSNVGYIQKGINSTGVNRASRLYHKFDDYTTSIFGIRGGERTASSNSDTIFDIDSLRKTSITNELNSIYEKPFQHFPDKSSITVIKECSDGTIVFGTDRNGIWRTTINENSYALPALTGDSTGASWGYTFEDSSFTAQDNIYYNSIKNSEPARRIGLPVSWYEDSEYSRDFFNIREKLYTYTVANTEDFYTALGAMTDFNNVVGGYFVVSESMNQIQGPLDRTKCKIFQIKEITDNGTSYELVLSAGEKAAKNTTPTDINLPSEVLDRWESDTTFTDWSTKKFCILDFEEYEDISGNLPVLSGIKNSKNNNESSLFIRDLSIGSNNVATIACGIGGVYYTNDITASTVSWTQLVFEYEATSVFYDSTNNVVIIGTWGNGIFSASLSNVSFSYGYGYGAGLGIDYFDVFDLFSGGYGYGVPNFESEPSYAYDYSYGWGYERLGEFNSGLNHLFIWSLFKSSDGFLYAGTEHGGVYKLQESTWVREINGIARSQIFVWKTEKVPVSLASSFLYTQSNNLLSYSWGGGIMRTIDGGTTWEQLNSGLENFYVQDISICPTVSSSSYTAYAATCGGGVFINTDVFGSGSWSQLSITGLSETLNIDSVEVGLDADIVYIKCRINDLSIKDMPYYLKQYAGISLQPDTNVSNFEDYIRTGKDRGKNNRENNQYYLPLTPHIYGDKKHIVYKGTISNGSVTWSTLFDKHTGTESFASSVWGMSIVPTTDSDLRFLYKYSSDFHWHDRSFEHKDSLIYVTYESETLAEKKFEFDMKELDLFNPTRYGSYVQSEVYMSIDPSDTDIVYLSVSPYDINSLGYKMYRTDNNGTSWTNLSQNTGSGYKGGFNSKIEIATKESKIYSNFNNNIYYSTNQGSTWTQVSSTDLFDSPEIKIKGSVIYATNSRYVLIDYFGIRTLWRGIGSTPSETEWTQLTCSETFDNILNNCLTYSGTKLYISESDKIHSTTITGDTATCVTAFSGTVSFPAVASSVNNGELCFISGSNLKVTLDAFVSFATTNVTITFDATLVQKILFGSSDNNKEIFICANAETEYIRLFEGVKKIFYSNNENAITLTEDNIKFQAGDKIFFHDDDEAKIYSTEVISIANDEVQLLDTITSSIDSYYYDKLTNKTIITNTSIVVESPEKYVGNIIKIFSNSDYDIELYEEKVIEGLKQDGDNFVLYVTGDITSSLSIYAVPYFRIGYLLDYLESTFAGYAVSNRAKTSKYKGLWYTPSYEYEIDRISETMLEDTSKTYGCDNIILNSDNSVTTTVSDEFTRRDIQSSMWIRDDDIKNVTTNINNEVVCVTNSGLYVLDDIEANAKFRNYFFNSFEAGFEVAENETLLIDSNDKLYYLNKDLNWTFDGIQTIGSTEYIVNNINKAIKDSQGIYWIASDDSLWAFYKEQYSKVLNGYIISDIMEDSENRIWACAGSDGCFVSSFSIDTVSLSEIEWTNYRELNGLSGSVNAISERFGIGCLSNGAPTIDIPDPFGGTTPYIQLFWQQGTSIYDSVILMRSKTSGKPILEEITYYSPINGEVASIEDAGNTWKITHALALTTEEEDRLVGRYMYVNSKETHTRRLIESFDTNSVNVSKSSSDESAPTEIGKNFIIVDNADNADVMFVSDTTTSTVDTSVVLDTNYYYYLYRYNSDEELPNYIIVDNKKVPFTSSIFTLFISDIILSGSEGVYTYKPFNEPTFLFVREYQTFSTITHSVIDSLNKMWLSVGSYVLKHIYSDGPFYLEDKKFHVDDLFHDQSESFSDLTVRNIVEGHENKVYVATNLGVVSINIIDDSSISYTSTTPEDFIRNNATGEIINTNWQAIELLTVDEVDEYIPNEIENDFDKLGTPAHICLSESDSDTYIFAGMYNPLVTSTEVEIVKLKSDGITYTSLGASNNLSIQSVYDFSEANSNIFAACKDNIVYKTLNGEWSIIPLNNDFNKEYIYTNVEARYDASAIGVSSGLTVYATKTDIFGNNMTEQEIVSIRNVSLANINNTITTYDLLDGFVSNDQDSTEIYQVDKNIFSEYRPQEFASDILQKNIGSLHFISNQNCLLVGGFDNTIFLLPFTSEASTTSTKSNTGFISSRRGILDTDLPLTNQTPRSYPSFNKMKDREPSYMDELIRPRSGWGIYFADDVGYASFIQFGQNTDRLSKTIIKDSTYACSSSSDVGSIMKTTDGGMLWQQFITSSALVSDIEPSGSDLIVSCIYGNGSTNVGVFKIDSDKVWTQYTEIDSPGSVIKNIEGTIYVGTIGSGVYKLSGNSFISHEARFPTQKGLSIGKWNISHIDIDSQNKNRMVAGTTEHGIIETPNANASVENREWYFDNSGIPSGNITALKLLLQNPSVVLAGVSGYGLYRKNTTTKIYDRITSGLPSSGNVNQIVINKEVGETFIQVEFEYTQTDANSRLVILRTPFLPARDIFTGSSTTFFVGYEKYNSEIIYIGEGSFTNNIYKDNAKKLRNGIPYYYDFYERTGTDTYVYTEIGILAGRISSFDIDNKEFQLLGTFPVSTTDYLKNRLATFDPGGYIEQKYRITSNTSTSFIVEFDNRLVINHGRFPWPEFTNHKCLIRSTKTYDAAFINFVYTIYNTGIYISYDSALTWESLDVSDLLVSGTAISSLSISPKPSEDELIEIFTLFVTTDYGVYKSENNGVSWSELSTIGGTNGLPNSTAYDSVLIDQEDSNIIYTITTAGKFYRTIDNTASWNMVNDFGESINNYKIVSDFANFIYTGSDENGLYKFEDSIREVLEVGIDADGKITFFDFDYFEMGDIYSTDTNSVRATTLVKNDNPALETREQFVFEVDDDTKYLSMKFSKSKKPFDITDVFIGAYEDNPSINPFVIQNPFKTYTNIVVNKIGNISSTEVYSLTNKGMYTSTNNGIRWLKNDSASLPTEINDVSSVSSTSDELLLATENGVWISENDRTTYRLIESEGYSVKTIWSNTIGSVRYLFRGGENGLKVTIQGSKSLIVYTGDNTENKFSWGDPYYPNDGSWSDDNDKKLSRPIQRKANYLSNELTTYDDWDAALIVRTGPYLTYSTAYNDSVANRNIFIPENLVLYPNTLTNGDFYNNNINVSPIFSISDNKEELEIKRNWNYDGGIGLPSKTDSIYDSDGNASGGTTEYMDGGNIIIGILNNRRGNPPAHGPLATLYTSQVPAQGSNESDEEYEARVPFDTGPNTQYPVIDRVRPFQGDRGGTDEPNNNVVNEEYYASGSGTALEGLPMIPDIVPEMYYIYRIYPYRNMPNGILRPTNDGQSLYYPEYPEYRLLGFGDIPDSYSYVFEMDNFSGSTVILCGTMMGNDNWVIGTDNGIFYSSDSGRKINQSSITGEVPSVFYTSSEVLLAILKSGEGQIQIIKSTNGSDWEAIESLKSMFYVANVERAYNFTEYNSEIYISTNAGMFRGNVDGTSWFSEGHIGDHEAVTNGRVLGQSFTIS